MKYRAFIFVIMLSSCIKEENTFSDTYFKNSSSHVISVNPYSNGSVNNQFAFSLSINEEKEVYHNNTRGLGKGLSYGRINQPMDSFLVTFDNLYSIVHYKPPLIGTNTKRYLYSSKRNIYNDSSYTANLLKDEKYQRSWKFIYTFTEQDYLDAK